MKAEQEEQPEYVISFRIKFTEPMHRFLKDYKMMYGSTIQWFVETAINEKIQQVIVKEDLGEL